MESNADRKDTVSLQTYLQNNGAYDQTLFALPEDIRERIDEQAKQRPFRSADELRAYAQSLLNKS